MRRAVSSLIAVLIISLVMLSALSAALTLSSSIRRSSEDSAAKIGQILTDASTPIEIRLEHSQGLWALIMSPRPVEVRYFLLEFKNGTLLQLQGGTFENSRVRLLESYSCSPVRLHAVLSSGLVAASRWHSCSLPESSGGSLGFRDAELGEALVVTARTPSSRAVDLALLLMASLEIREDCTMYFLGNSYQARALLQSWETSIGRVEVWAHCERPPGYRPIVVTDRYSWQALYLPLSNLPLVVYLTIEGPPGVSFSGVASLSVNAQIFSTFEIYHDQVLRNPLVGVLPMGYSPGGSSDFHICHRSAGIYPAHMTLHTFEGGARVNFTGSRKILALVWASPPSPPLAFQESKITLGVGLSIRRAKVFESAAELNLTLPAGSKLELIPLRLSGTDLMTEALSRFLRGTPHVEVVVLGEVRYARDLSSPLYFDRETRVTLRYYPVELPPPGLPQLRVNFYVSENCPIRIEGSVRGGVLPAPWGGPALVRAANLTLILGASQELRAEQGGSSSTGYARLLPEAGFSFSRSVALYPMRWEEGGAIVTLSAVRSWRGLALAVDGQGNQMIVRLD